MFLLSPAVTVLPCSIPVIYMRIQAVRHPSIISFPPVTIGVRSDLEPELGDL